MEKTIAPEGLTAAVVTIVAFILSLDGEALIGAFAGGSLYAIRAKEISIPTRFVYMTISLVAGYLGRNLMFQILGYGDTGISALFVSGFTIFSYILITDNIDFKTIISALKAWAKSKGL